MRHPALLLTLVLLLALGFSGCSPQSPGPGAPSAPMSGSASSPPDDAEPEITEAERTQAPTEPPTGDEFSLDDAARYDDGLQFEVLEAVRATANAGDTGAEGTDGQFVRVTVLLTNGTPTDYDPSRVLIRGYYGDGVGAPMVLDEAGRFATGFGEPVPSGEDRQTTVAFAVPADAARRITVQIDPGDEGIHPAVRFSGAAR